MSDVEKKTYSKAEIKLAGILEGVLFTMGKSVEISRIAEALEYAPQVVERATEYLADKYAKEGNGLQILRLEDSLQLATKPELFDTLVKIASTPKKPVLTDTVLETLSIVAYRQPVTRADIERIRGVSSDHAVNKLVEYGLIEEVGRLDAPGRPILFATSEEFLRVFGVSSIADLPILDEQQVEQFKEEAEVEIGT